MNRLLRCLALAAVAVVGAMGGVATAQLPVLFDETYYPNNPTNTYGAFTFADFSAAGAFHRRSHELYLRRAGQRWLRTVYSAAWVLTTAHRRERTMSISIPTPPNGRYESRSCRITRRRRSGRPTSTTTAVFRWRRRIRVRVGSHERAKRRSVSRTGQADVRLPVQPAGVQFCSRQWHSGSWPSSDADSERA